MKTLYIVNEQMGNYSDVVGVFDTEEQASDYILEKAQAQAEYNAQGVGEELDSSYEDELQLQISYFSIEEEECTLESVYHDCNNEDELMQYGDNIIDTFYNGNFSQGVKQLREINATAIEFGDYIQSKVEEYGLESMEDFANNHFNYNFFICLGREAL